MITRFLTDELYCDKHKNMNKDEIIGNINPKRKKRTVQSIIDN